MDQPTNRYKNRRISPKKKQAPPYLQFILDDLCSRFLVNCPIEEFQSFDRICFQLELAHWFFEDNYRVTDLSLPSYSLKEFITIMFQHCVILQPFANKVDKIFESWFDYKTRVPGYGAIILNPTLEKCLLVKGCGPRSSWGFPRGKINQNEMEVDCAVREVFEETGFDIKGLISEKEYIEKKVREQTIKLYVIPFIPEILLFNPKQKMKSVL